MRFLWLTSVTVPATAPVLKVFLFLWMSDSEATDVGQCVLYRTFPSHCRIRTITLPVAEFIFKSKYTLHAQAMFTSDFSYNQMKYNWSYLSSFSKNHVSICSIFNIISRWWNAATKHWSLWFYWWMKLDGMTYPVIIRCEHAFRCLCQTRNKRNVSDII